MIFNKVLRKINQAARKTDKILDLSGMKIAKLPPEIGKLFNLRNLRLRTNKLKTLPAEIGKLTKLTEFYLDNNPLDSGLAAAYKQGTDAVLRYLREFEAGEVILNEAKLILVGEGNVGKSCLLRALRGDPWVKNSDTTHGVEIKPVTLTDPDSGVELTLNCWDFGGQPVYRPTHQLFFSAPAVYLVVWEPRRGPAESCVDEWIKLIKHRAFDEQRPENRRRVLIVATHGGPKERQAHIDQQTRRDLFGDLIVDFYHVDSFTGDGIAKLKKAIAQTTSTIPQVGRKVPGSWKRILDAVKERGKTDTHISYKEYEKLCLSQKVDSDLADMYARILNELGHIIHYADDEGLKDIVILKADWLSKAISFVLEDSLVSKQSGLIEHARLGEIWNSPDKPKDDRYPTELHPIFLRLMERFDLSYRVMLPVDGQITEPPATSLIAQLVPGARPDELAGEWGEQAEDGDVERTQVCRIVDAQTGDSARAEGLIYRLIVRLHRYSPGRDNYTLSRHWQGGLLLDDDYNGRALLEELGTDIRITVRAAYPERFLHLLCEEVKWLVENFWKGLDCKIAVPCAPPCRGMLGIEDLINARQDKRPEYPCSVCGNWLNIDTLLAKPPEMPEYSVALAELKQGQMEIKQGMNLGFQSVRFDLRRLISQADEYFAALMTTLIDEARDGPRLFSLTPVEPKLWQKPKWISQKVRLTLWCEHSRLPLPVLWEDENRGVYEFEQPREWLTKVAPYARFVAGALNLVLPVAGSAVKFAMDDNTYKQIAEQLDLSQKTFSGLLGAGKAAGDLLTRSDDLDFDPTPDEVEPHSKSLRNLRHHGAPRAAEGAMLRLLQDLLGKKDPGFGGLKRVQNKRREFLWIHPRFTKEYYPDPPVIPQRREKKE